MNPSIKRRQTLLASFLYGIGCKPITIAETGSLYAEYNTLYTGKSIVRISDHLSNHREYIHVILSPLNTVVVINYKNFMWSGNFATAKQILFSLIMSKAMTELAPTSPSNTKNITSQVASKKKKTYTFEQRVVFFGKSFATEIRAWKKAHPKYENELKQFVEVNHCKSEAEKRKLWAKFKSEHNK